MSLLRTVALSADDDASRRALRQVYDAVVALPAEAPVPDAGDAPAEPVSNPDPR